MTAFEIQLHLQKEDVILAKNQDRVNLIHQKWKHLRMNRKSGS